MHRCGSRLIFSFTVGCLLALTGCLGKSSSNANSIGVQSVTLSPSSNFSMDIGTSQVFSATAKNADGGTLLGIDIQYIVESATQNTSAPISMASNGNACAGTWDASVAICSPGTPGIALIRAVANGVSSATTTVYVHQHIDSIQIKQAESQPPQYDCFSQGQSWQYEGTAFSNNIDITNTVGPLSWTFNNSQVVTLTPLTTGTFPNQQLNQVQAVAKSPGITNIFAEVSGTTSAPYPFTTCLVQAVYLQIGGQGQAGNSVTVNNGSAVSITAIAVDSLCGVANNVPLTSPPLTWSTTDPEVAAFATTTNTSSTNSATARNNLGGATLTASCTPPSCNIGVLPSTPVYASNYDQTLPNQKCRPLSLSKGYSAISVDVNSTSPPPTYTVWAATTDCDNQPGCSSAMFSVAPGLTPIGSILSLPRTPNSLLFNHQATSRAYLGSNQGLMFVDVNTASPTVSLVSQSPTPCNISLCGKVLTISNDGKLVVVSDTISSPSQVYIYTAGSSTPPVDLTIPGQTATAAAFSPDQLKIFILTDTGNMYVYSTLDALDSVPIATSVTDVKFAADGSLAYVAGNPTNAVSAFSTCGVPNEASVDIGSVMTSSTPLAIFPSPAIPLPVLDNNLLWTSQNLLALEPPSGSNNNTSIEFLTAEFAQSPLLDGHFTCNPPMLNSFTKGPSFSLGQGNLTPVYSQLVADGTQMIVVARHINAVLLFNVADGSTTSVPLVGNADPLSADASTDGSQVYVASCDQYGTDGVTCAAGSIHIVCTSSCTTGQGDYQQVPYINMSDANDMNMCNSQGGTAPLCLPNLVAIKPQ